jgi:hypothetical protein
VRPPQIGSVGHRGETGGIVDPDTAATQGDQAPVGELAERDRGAFARGTDEAGQLVVREPHRLRFRRRRIRAGHHAQRVRGPLDHGLRHEIGEPVFQLEHAPAELLGDPRRDPSVGQQHALHIGAAHQAQDARLEGLGPGAPHTQPEQVHLPEHRTRAGHRRRDRPPVRHHSEQAEPTRLDDEQHLDRSGRLEHDLPRGNASAWGGGGHVGHLPP